MPDFEGAHAELRAIMLAGASGLIVSRDAPGDLEIRTPGIDPATGKAGWFGIVAIKKSYVAYHLMPLYTNPDLADTVSAALAKRRQGKTCFNFTKVDPALFAELAELTSRARAAIG